VGGTPFPLSWISLIWAIVTFALFFLMVLS
jgi:hypothetical protein